MVPVALTVGTFAATWWYVVIYNAPAAQSAVYLRAQARSRRSTASDAVRPHRRRSAAGTRSGGRKAPRTWSGRVRGAAHGTAAGADAPPEEMGSWRSRTVQSAAGKVPAHFYQWFWGLAAFSVLLAHHLLPAHGRRAVRDSQGAVRLGGAARSPHVRGARGDPVRHLHRNRVRGNRRARRDVPRGHDEVPAPGLVVESHRGDHRHRARVVRRRRLRVAARIGFSRRHVLGNRRAGGLKS